MMFMTFMHVFDNHYASRITLYSEHPTIDSSTRPHTKLTKFLTRNVKYMLYCTLPSIFQKLLIYVTIGLRLSVTYIEDVVCSMLMPNAVR